MAILTPPPVLIIGEVGVVLSILVNPVNTAQPVNLNLASSIILVVQYPDMITTTQLSMNPSTDGNSAIRVLLAGDFPVVGDYLLELVVGIGSDIFKTAPFTLAVGGIF